MRVPCAVPCHCAVLCCAALCACCCAVPCAACCDCVVQGDEGDPRRVFGGFEGWLSEEAIASLQV